LDRHRADAAAEPAAWATAAAPESNPDTAKPCGSGPACRSAPGRDADADAAGDQPRPAVQFHRHGELYMLIPINSCRAGTFSSRGYSSFLIAWPFRGP
jgi:hypothetical protein